MAGPPPPPPPVAPRSSTPPKDNGAGRANQPSARPPPSSGGSIRGSSSANSAAGGPMGLGALFANGGPKLKPVGSSRDNISSVASRVSQPPPLAPKVNKPNSTPSAVQPPPPTSGRPRGPSVGAKPGSATGSPASGNTPKLPRAIPRLPSGSGTNLPSINKQHIALASRPPPPRPGSGVVEKPLVASRPPPPSTSPPSRPTSFAGAQSSSREFDHSKHGDGDGGLVSSRLNAFGGGSALANRRSGSGAVLPHASSRHSLNNNAERWTFRKDYPPPRPFPGSSPVPSAGRPTSTTSPGRPPVPVRSSLPPPPARRPPRPGSGNAENIDQFISETLPKLDAELENCISRQDFMRCAAVKAVKERLLKLNNGPPNVDEFNKVRDEITRNGYA